MVFSSLIFLFFYLPLVLLLYFVLPSKYRNGFLFFANLIFYAWGEPVFVVVMIVAIIINYFFGLGIEKHPSKAKILLVIGIVIDLSLLFFFKYAAFFREIAVALTGLPLGNFPEIALPIGISFYTFQSLSYLVDIYRRDIAAEKSFICFGTYLAFFPQLIAGPIVRYDEMSADLHRRRVTKSQFSEGVSLFLIGLGKKVCIANEMGVLWEQLRPLAATEGLLAAHVGIIAFALQIYFDFSGYSDMARGLGKMFGFSLPVNFNYPYHAESLTDFWRRWHMTLTRWFRDYVYIPCGGNRKGTMRTVLNLFLVWSLTGLWHGADYNFILWGIYWFALLCGEKFLWQGLLKKVPKVIRSIYSWVFILIGWVLFSLSSMGEIGTYLTAMFTLKNGFLHGDSVTYILSYLPLLLVALFAAMPYGKQLWQKLSAQRYASILEFLGLTLIFLFAVASLTNQSYNPFLYFRF